MKILVDFRLINPKSTSGIQEYAIELFSALRAENTQNEYTLFLNSLRKKELPERLQKTKSPIVNWRIPNKALDLSTRFLKYPKIDTLIKTDLIFSPHFTLLATKNVPRIITFHDLSFLHHPEFFSLRKRFWHNLQDWQNQAQEATSIIAVSEFTRNDLLKNLGLPAHKVHTIYSGVNANLQPLKSDSPALLDFQKKHALNFPFFLYLGTLEPRKNITAIIRAFNILKKNHEYQNFRLIIAGNKGWLYKKIFEEAELSPSKSHIIFWGPVEEEEKKFLYTLGSVFVYPSFFEGFGFPPLEAQACGTPVVVSDRTSLKEILDEGALYADPWRVNDLSQMMNLAATDEVTRKTLIQKGLQNSARFSWKTTAEKTLELFKKYDKKEYR